jgi:hypothetical protein
MTKRERYLERMLILKMLTTYGPLPGLNLADRCNTECDHDAWEAVAPISRRAMGQKLSAMTLDGLVYGTQPRFKPLVWHITDHGRKVLTAFEAEEPS